MAYTESDLQARITALEGALDRQVYSVEFNGRKTTYSSTDEIIARLNYFKTQLSRARQTRRQIVIVGDKGLA